MGREIHPLLLLERLVKMKTTIFEGFSIFRAYTCIPTDGSTTYR